MAEGPQTVIATVSLSGDTSSDGAVTVKLYDDGTIMLKGDDGALVVLSILQQRLLRRFIPNNLAGA